jgi:ABC-type multidrug transport system fused ATPase/permease subunit
MRGRVLGYHEGSGVIVGDDDQRFNFTTANWRDSAPPQPGTLVDFVSREGIADDIYPVLGAAAGGVGAGAGGFGAGAGAAGAGGYGHGAGAGAAGNPFGTMGQNPFIRGFIAKVRAFPQMVVAFFILLFFLILTYASVGDPISDAGTRGTRAWPNDNVSMAGLNSKLSDWREDIEVVSEEIEEKTADIRDTKQERQADDAQDALSAMGWTLGFAHLFWLIPLLAIAVMVLYWLSLTLYGMIAGATLGVLCALSPFFMIVWRGQIHDLFRATQPEDRAGARRAIDNAFELGFGAWLICLLGVAMVALVFIFRRRPGPTV